MLNSKSTFIFHRPFTYKLHYFTYQMKETLCSLKPRRKTKPKQEKISIQKWKAV